MKIMKICEKLRTMVWDNSCSSRSQYAHCGSDVPTICNANGTGATLGGGVSGIVKYCIMRS